MINKKISIIIPCHNSSQTLDDTWNSLKNQTIGIENLECIFVDDASDDEGKTWEKLADIEQECPESVMIIHLDENLRQGGARNVGLSYASGEYIMFLDSDDRFVAPTCEVAYHEINHTDSDIVQFNHIRRLGNKEKRIDDVKLNMRYNFAAGDDRNRFLDASTVTYGCWNKIYRASLVRKANSRFSEHTVYEEPLFVYPCFIYADRVSLITDALYIYNIHEGSTITSFIGKKLFDHPKVQLELLEYCISRPEIFEKYRNVFGLYFLWSYYCETICFAYENKVVLPLEYFDGMQNVCKKIFPDWKENPFMKRIPHEVVEVLNGINSTFTSQEELNKYVFDSAKKL